LLNLRHNLHRHWPYHDAWVLLAHQVIHSIQYLIAEAGLPDSTGTCRNHQWPENRGRDEANSPHSGFVYPLLLSNHGEYAAAGALNDDSERGLQADNGLEITPLFQLHHHLIGVAYLLYLIVLRTIHILQFICQSLNIYFF
jgi:hypothetical protein